MLRDKKNLGRLLWGVLRWHGRHFFNKTPAPLSCGVYLTSRCNLQCDFCNIHRKPGQATLSLQKGRQVISNLSELGCFYLSFSGGEPLLVEHVFELLEHARAVRIPYRHLVTNGFLLDEECAARLGAADLNEVSISIDGREDVHDRIRGVDGSYKQVLSAVEHLKSCAPQVSIVLNTVLFPDNPEECLPVVDLARRLDVFIKVQPLNQHPEFDPQNDVRVSRQDIDSQRLREVLDRLKQEKRVINSRPFLDNIYNFFCRKERLIFREDRCFFGFHHLEVSEDALVFPCLEGMDWCNGMDDHGDLKALLRSRSYRQTVDQLKTCQGCRKNYYICYYEPRIAFPVGNAVKSLFSR